MIIKETNPFDDGIIRERVERCRARLELVLADHDCRLEAIMHITGKGVFPQIIIVPREQAKSESKELGRETC
jgi:hypothetical protein